MLQTLKLKKPLEYWGVNQYFGLNFNNFYKEIGMKGHNGIDLFALDSTPVYASHDGRVTFAGYDGAGGLGVVIRTLEEFADSEGTGYFWKTVYWHLKKDTLKVTGGQNVKAGDLIGLADNTGRSTGSHLHWGLKPIEKGEEDWIWWNAVQDNGYMGAVDPMPYVEVKYGFTQFLRFGSVNNDVKQLQIKLDIKPFDGIFGKLTLAGVKKFQKEQGLIVDGLVGRNTRAKLNE